MRFKDIIHKNELISSDILPDQEISEITSDIKKILPYSLLILPNSRKIPSFINNKEKQPFFVLCDKNAQIPPSIPTARAVDIRSSYANAFSRFFDIDYTKMRIIGVTGTNGKTTTASLIRFGLELSGYSVGYIGTGKIMINDQLLTDRDYSMTTPDPPLLYKTLSEMEKAGCKYVVMEISSHALALEKVCPIRFEYGVFTNLSDEHLDFHGNTEQYFLAKSKLFLQSEKAVINIDDYYGRRLAEEIKCPTLKVGVLWRGDIWATNISYHGQKGMDFLYRDRNFSFQSHLSMPGMYNIYNAMLATATCADMGIKPHSIKKRFAEINGIEGRYEIINDEITVIIDYAHTSTAFEYFLRDIYRTKNKDSKITAVFGCGGERDRNKRPKMALAAQNYTDRIIVTNDNSRNESPDQIIKDITDGFDKNVKYEIINDRRCAIEAAISNAEIGDIIAIIGKGAEKYNIDSLGYHKFDEREIINEALKKRHENKA